METSVPKVGTRRREDFDKNGYSTKFAYHIIRLLDEVEQILVEEDLDLTRNREQLKAIRRGEWTKLQIRDHFDAKEKSLELAYTSCQLPRRPDDGLIKALLIDCLEEHYGSIAGCISVNTDERGAARKLREIENIINS